jgi:hypothetical protein
MMATDEIQAEIMRYLASQPSGQDTLEGISGWMESVQRPSRPRSQVQIAILELQAKGFIVKVSDTNSRTHYRLARRNTGAGSGHSLRNR